MSTYTSKGTISVRCIRRDDKPKTVLLFVPENDYSIKHGNKKFAVFVPQSCDCTPQSCNKAIIRRYDGDKGNGVKICVDALGCTEVISGAAVHQKNVEVWVKEKTSKTPESKKKCSEAKQGLKLKLIGITVPAK